MVNQFQNRIGQNITLFFNDDSFPGIFRGKIISCDAKRVKCQDRMNGTISVRYNEIILAWQRAMDVL